MRPWRARDVALVSLCALLALTVALAVRIRQDPSSSGGEPPQEALTFNKNVAPIVFHHCAPCHRPGEAGPFSLLSYADVRKHERQILAVTRRRFMPPWLPAPGFVDFVGERRLSDSQIATLAEWVRSGSREGDPSDLPPLPRAVEGWQLGEPDLVLEMTQPYILPASGPEVFRNFVLSVPGSGLRYVRALEIRPGNKEVVRHASVRVDRARFARQLDAADREPGFPGMDLRLETGTFDPESRLLFWGPGSPPIAEPEDMAWTIDKGTDIILNLHLLPSGQPERIDVAVGLYFTDQPPTQLPMLLRLDNDAALDIPAGASDFRVDDDIDLPVDVDVLAVYPHAHHLGKALDAYATLPDGTRKWLVRIPEWDPSWQAVYRYGRPLFLPKGSKVSMRYTYDNSAENLSNPNTPPRRVTRGERAGDEMAHLSLQVLPRGRGDLRPALQETASRHRLRRNPRDVAAVLDLANALLRLGRTAEAAAELEGVLRLDPGNAQARQSLALVRTQLANRP